MSDRKNEENKKMWSSFTQKEQLNIYHIYQAQGQYCTDIIKSMADKLFSWFFILNTGGLVGVLTLISTTIHNNDKCNLLLIIILGCIFLIGIVCSIIAVICEQNRFIKKGEQLDKDFDQLQGENMTVEEFIKNSFSTNTSKNIWRLEKASFSCFIIGFILGCYIIISNFA